MVSKARQSAVKPLFGFQWFLEPQDYTNPKHQSTDCKIIVVLTGALRIVSMLYVKSRPVLFHIVVCKLPSWIPRCWFFPGQWTSIQITPSGNRAGFWLGSPSWFILLRKPSKQFFRSAFLFLKKLPILHHSLQAFSPHVSPCNASLFPWKRVFPTIYWDPSLILVSRITYQVQMSRLLSLFFNIYNTC